MAKSEYDVVIVGAGPVGLFTALRLSRFNISCLVLEAEDELAEDLRASTFHPPTLDILDDYGLAKPLIEQGRICSTWQIRMHPSHERVEFDLSILKADTKHPFRLQCEQFRLCRLLWEELEKCENTEVRFGCRVVGLDQSEENVTVQAETAQGSETITARFAIGADGARSVVRQSLNLAFKGETYPETTILATTAFRFEDHLPGLSGINYIWAPKSTFSLLHLPKIWRCSLYQEPDETVEEAIRPEAIERKLQEILPQDQPYVVDEIRPYRLHMRIVDDYRKGRVVLVGDSAHLNSPSGGMGMNGGLHDAYFLTEALHNIFRGGSLELLDQYTRKRQPVARDQILVQADANRKRMQERDPERRRTIFEDLCRTAGDHQKCYEFLLKSSMIAGWRQSVEVV